VKTGKYGPKVLQIVDFLAGRVINKIILLMKFLYFKREPLFGADSSWPLSTAIVLLILMPRKNRDPSSSTTNAAA